MLDLIIIQDTKLPSVMTLEQIDLADYIRRVREQELGISLEEVVRRAKLKGFKISRGYISQIENRYIVSPTALKLQAIAAGLGKHPEELFAVARGRSLTYDDPLDEIKVLFNGWSEATDEDRSATMEALRMIAVGFQQRRSRNNREQ
ncbi:MAG: helix-turn-helix transcriptional regulator [Acidobacteriota bacterium]|nr:helix-turn-helix transcriptional regulator [Acidobacteriota bacterium]